MKPSNTTQDAEKAKSEMSQIKVRYVQCEKSGLHFGQVCNMVCMEPSCLEDLICCCSCIEEGHKKHLTKPLKMIMVEAKNQADMMKPNNFNIDVILDIMRTSQKATLDIFHSCKNQILTNLDAIEKSLVGYYNSISEQIKLKNSDPKVQVAAAFSSIETATNVDTLKESIKKLVAMIPTSKDQEQQLFTQINESQLIESLNNCNEQINKMISTNISEVNTKLRNYEATLQSEINATNIWKKNQSFKFSPEYKHLDVKVLSDHHVKSQNTSSYKFAIMEPSLEKSSQKVRTFYFKIRECHSNWVAVGMCHKNIVVSKNYGFNFSSLGHGAYMVSSNGGSWSNISNDYNNKVKAFKFIKGDIIGVTVDFNQDKVLFKKKAESFEIPFTKIPGNELHLCALFYYVNDEVEFLPNYRP